MRQPNQTTGCGKSSVEGRRHNPSTPQHTCLPTSVCCMPPASNNRFIEEPAFDLASMPRRISHAGAEHPVPNPHRLRSWSDDLNRFFLQEQSFPELIFDLLVPIPGTRLICCFIREARPIFSCSRCVNRQSAGSFQIPAACWQAPPAG
jgi:hypothetical protein